MFCVMLEALYTLASISLQVLLLSQPFQTQIGLGTLLIRSLQLDFRSSLAPIQFRGPPRSNPQFLVLPLWQNIVLWPQQLLNYPGFVPCSSSFVCIFITFQSFGVITSLLLPQLPILLFIPGPSTLKLIITLLEQRLLGMTWGLNSSLERIIMLIFSPSPYLGLLSCFFVANSWLIQPRV